VTCRFAFTGYTDKSLEYVVVKILYINSVLTNKTCADKKLSIAAQGESALLLGITSVNNDISDPGSL
jgi:hypothetical protein